MAVIEGGEFRWIGGVALWPVLIEDQHITEIGLDHDTDVPIRSHFEHTHITGVWDGPGIILEKFICLPITVVLPVDGVPSKSGPATEIQPLFHQGDTLAWEGTIRGRH